MPYKKNKRRGKIERIKRYIHFVLTKHTHSSSCPSDSGVLVCFMRKTFIVARKKQCFSKKYNVVVRVKTIYKLRCLTRGSVHKICENVHCTVAENGM